METCKSEKFRELVRAFNEKLGKDHSNRLRATRSYWAPIDEVSKLKQLFFSGDKKLHIGEAVLFEQDVRKSDYSTKKFKMSAFVDKSGRWCDRASYSNTVSAFVHFTHQYSNGELVVCGLNGIKDEEGFFFSTPSIHSMNSMYGHMDGGEQGIREVIANHTCGKMCQDILRGTHFNIPTSPCIDINNGQKNAQRNYSSQSSVFADESIDCRKMATSPSSQDSVSSSRVSDLMDSVEFLAPSAPEMEEINGNVLPPPPYTPAQERRIALWIIGEESQNTFLQISPGSLLPCDRRPMGSSNECHSGHTGHPTTGSVDLDVPDINANFSYQNKTMRENEACSHKNDAHFPVQTNIDNATRIKPTTEADIPREKMEPKNKQVRFEDPPSNHRVSPATPSVFTGHSDDVTMDTYTNPSFSSSPTLPVRFRYNLSHDSTSTDDRYYGDNSYDNNNSSPGTNLPICSNGIETTDLPPPYEEPDIATANWLLSRSGFEMHSYRAPLIYEARTADNGMMIGTQAINNNNNNNHPGIYIPLSPHERIHSQAFNFCFNNRRL